jgi:hypothetical protein
LSTNTTGTVFVKATGETTVSIVLEGAVHYVILTVAQNIPPVGTPATIGVTATLEDADQNLIVGPAPYEYPVTLTATDFTDGPLSKTTLNSPADTVGITVNYTGAKVASIIYSATATGLAPANVSNTVLTPGARHLYVANFNNTVSVFNLADLSAPPTKITGGGLSCPSGAAVDASGKLYAANGNVSSVSVFDTAHGNAVLPAITGGGLFFPQGAAIDASGKLYVANSHNFNRNSDCISVFDTAHGNAVLPAIKHGGLSSPWGVAVDASNGLLYVTNDSPNSVVSVFDTAHGNAALPLITGGGLSSPRAWRFTDTAD